MSSSGRNLSATFAPRLTTTHQTGNYTAAPGELVMCDGAALQVITMPANPKAGDIVAVVRGTNVQQINLSANVGQTINGLSGQNVFAPGNLVSTAYSARAHLVAVSATDWVAVAMDSFVENLGGSGRSFNDIQVAGTAYLAYNVWLTSTSAISASGTVGAGVIVERYTGAGGYTRTADVTFGTTQILFIKNDSSGVVTFLPNGTGTIDGAASLILHPGEAALVMCLASGANGNWAVLHLSRVTLTGHFAIPGGNTPTISSVNAGLASVTVAGNDTRGLITITVGASNVAAFTGLFTVNFGGALYQSPPVVMLTEQDANQFPGPQAYNVATSGFNVTNAGGVLGAGQTYKLGYLVVG